MEKRQRALAILAQHYGLTVDNSVRGHPKLRDDAGNLVYTAHSSASDVRALRNVEAALRRLTR